MYKKYVKIILVFIFVASLVLEIHAEEIDTATGLIKAQGWDTVRNNCIACHSTKLITQNHGSRNRWEAIIEWMQVTQGLQQFDVETQDTILTYLATYYGPKKDARRALLDPHLMPKNPYQKTLQPQVVSPEKK
jgi:hypothetical protein